MSGSKRPRNHKQLDQFYKDAIATIGALLIEQGFSEESLEFRRYDETGFDRVAITLPNTRSFSVVLSYYPKAIEWVSDFKPKPGCDSDFGFPCGPYLNPFRVDNRPRTWPIAAGKTEKSLANALTALQEVGLPWLRQLKDPSFFADAVDRSNFQIHGAALEAAGRFDEAKNEYLRRIGILERCRDIPRLPISEQQECNEQIEMFKRRIADLPLAD